MMPFIFDEDEPPLPGALEISRIENSSVDIVMIDEDRTSQDAQEQLKREAEERRVQLETEMERRSKSPEFAGGITLTMKDGRPISRGEVIERLKRGENPTWTIRHNGVVSSQPPSVMVPVVDRTAAGATVSLHMNPVLLPSPDIREGRMDILEEAKEEQSQDQDMVDLAAEGLEIERPRSALHSGDFRGENEPTTPPNFHKHDFARHETSSFVVRRHHVLDSPLSISPPAPWSSRFTPFSSRNPFDGPRSLSRTDTSTPVSIFRSSTLYLPATSPLFHAHSTNPDRPHSPSPSSSPLALSPGNSTPRAIPYQAHQPRRSGSTPHTPPTSNGFKVPSRPRGSSTSFHPYNSVDGIFSSSPIHNRAPMVGSYEESILRGRMSATPSKPLNFIAQLGVLGRGKCRPSLRCPPHQSVEFPAVFYSYPNITTIPGRNNGSMSARLALEDQPSPYVGLIDVENNFPRFEKADKDGGAGAPSGGCYRIPQKGQLQIIIKNPNKTAVKLFLVPYDLTDMVPGQKTFIRQRSFSAAGEEDGLPNNTSGNDSGNVGRQTLRYLIHLHICCPSKGRYFLYKSIRVVFANRVPDGKEKLRNEVQYPEPKYSAWIPAKENNSTHHANGLAMQSSGQKLENEDLGMSKSFKAKLNEKKQETSMRRRSTPVAFKLNPLHSISVGFKPDENNRESWNGLERGFESSIRDQASDLGLSYGTGTLTEEPRGLDFSAIHNTKVNSKLDDLSNPKNPEISEAVVDNEAMEF